MLTNGPEGAMSKNIIIMSGTHWPTLVSVVRAAILCKKRTLSFSHRNVVDREQVALLLYLYESVKLKNA